MLAWSRGNEQALPHRAYRDVARQDGGRLCLHSFGLFTQYQAPNKYTLLQGLLASQEAGLLTTTLSQLSAPRPLLHDTTFYGIDCGPIPPLDLWTAT